MGFIEHIPGTQPVITPPRHPKAIGVGVIGLHEGRTMLMALATRRRHVHAVDQLRELSHEPRNARPIARSHSVRDCSMHASASPHASAPT